MSDQFTSKTNRFKHDFVAQVSAPLRVPVFEPLKTHWAVSGHPKQERLEEYRAIASWVPK